MDAREGLAGLVERADRRAPGALRFLAGLRWGGLRTLHPGPGVWAAEAVSGALLGEAAVQGIRRVTGGWRAPVAVAWPAGIAAVHLSLWRWDALRWRRRRVALAVDLPAADVAALADRLDGEGLHVERWERGVRGERRAHGLWCRTRDVRAVNRAIDVALRGTLSR